jgi:hypothetical protein
LFFPSQKHFNTERGVKEEIPNTLIGGELNAVPVHTRMYSLGNRKDDKGLGKLSG